MDPVPGPGPMNGRNLYGYFTGFEEKNVNYNTLGAFLCGVQACIFIFVRVWAGAFTCMNVCAYNVYTCTCAVHTAVRLCVLHLRFFVR